MRILFAAPLLALSIAAAPAAHAQADDVVVVERNMGAIPGFPETFTASYVEQFRVGFQQGAVDTAKQRDIVVDNGALKTSVDIAPWSDRVMIGLIDASPKLFSYQYFGRVGPDVVMVVCASKSGKAFDIAGSACEQRAKQTFAR